jgi:deazaflavin-dependent oxidoreductase (nitroreductase family)
MPAARMSPSLRVFWRIHRVFMRLTGGRFGKVGPLDALLLTTKGRKSGERRDVAVYYLRDGDAYVVIASYVGQDRDPAWWGNLKAEPEAEVAVAGKRIRVRAREADGAERERLWIRIVEKDPAYAEYQRRTTRRLPVVLLEPMR